MNRRPGLSLLLAAALTLQGAAPPLALAATARPLALKVGGAKDFARLEFPGARLAGAKQDGKVLVLRFNGAGLPDMARLHVDPPRPIEKADAVAVSGGVELRLTLADNTNVKTGAADGAAFVLLTPGEAAKAAASAAHIDQAPKGRPDPVPQGGNVKVAAELQGASLALRFPWRAPLGAAVFRRGEAVWVVFDAKANLDLSALPRSMGPYRVFQPIAGADYTALRIPVPPLTLVGASAEGNSWVVTLGPRAADQPAAIALARDENGPAALTARMAGSTGVFWVADPAVGDKLAVVTALGPTKGVESRHVYVDATLLPSRHGLAVEAVADDLSVSADGDVVRLARPKGLALSTEGGFRKAESAPLSTPQAAAFPALINFTDWSKLGEGGFNVRYAQLLAAAMEEKAKGRTAGVQARLGFARFLLGVGMNYEAIGYLNMMAKQDQTLLATAEFRGLRGAAKAMAGRYKDAVAEFSSPALAMDPSASLWRGYVDVKTGDFAGARHEFAAGRKVASQFDPTWRARFAVADAEAALAQGDVASARHEVMVAAAEKLGAVDQDKLRFLQARVDEASAHPDLALAGYDAASHSTYGGVAAPALLRATQIRMAKGQERLPEAIAAYNSLRYLWRGDATELESIRALGQIYLSQGRYREALTALRSAGARRPDLPAGAAVQDDLAAAFRRLFLEGGADGLEPIQALALFYDFRDLAPVGADGDEMVRKLSRRLVDVDLLPQAAELLKYQADKRLDGVARAEVDTDLATIDLMDHKPEPALDAINASRTTVLPNALNARRRLVEARALMALGRFDHALEVLGADKSPDAQQLRADIAWQGKDWAKAGALLEARLGDRWKSNTPLTPAEEAALVRAGSAYSLANDDAALARLRQRFMGFAQGAHNPDAVRIALAGLDAGSARPASFAAVAADSDTFAGWFQDMKKRYLDKTAKSAN